jgi:septal ring factor EnvC (AmiA/AmiB activator)
MSDRVTLELLFAQGQRVLDEIREVRAEQRQRFGALESEIAYIGTELARLDARLDRINDRLDRIENRLGLVDSTD